MLFGLFNTSVEDIVSKFKDMSEQLRALAEAKDEEVSSLESTIKVLTSQKEEGEHEASRARKIASNIDKLVSG